MSRRLCFVPFALALWACSDRSGFGRLSEGSCRELPSAHASGVTALVFSREGSLLYTASVDSTVKVWEMPSGRLAGTWKDDSAGVYALALSADGKWLASGSANRIRFRELPSGKSGPAWQEHDPEIRITTPRVLAFTPDGSRFVSGSDLPDIKIWNFPAGELVGSYSDANGVALAVDGKGSKAFGGGLVPMVYEGPPLRNFGTAGHEPYSLAFSPDGKRLAAGYLDSVVVWEMPEGKSALALPGQLGGPTSLAYSPDGRWVAAGSEDGTVRVWEVAVAKLAYTLLGHGGDVTSVGFSPDGAWLVSASEDRTVRLWTMPAGEFSACLSDAAAGSAPPVDSVGTPKTDPASDSAWKSFDGFVGDLPVWMDLRYGQGDGKVTGRYEYRERGETIVLAGTRKDDRFRLAETHGGRTTGTFELSIATGEDGYFLEGIWRKPGKGATLPVSLRATEAGHKGCAQVSADGLWLADGSSFAAAIGDWRAEPPDEEEDATGEAAPEGRSFAITGCLGGLMGTSAASVVDRMGNTVADTRLFELARRREVELMEEIEAHKLARFREQASRWLDPRLAEIRGGIPDEDWRQALANASIQVDSVGEFFSGSGGFDLKLRLVGDRIDIGIIRFLGLDILEAMELGVPDEVFVEIPYAELRKYLRKNSVLRGLGGGG